MASSAYQAGFRPATGETGAAAAPRYALTAGVSKMAPGMPWPSRRATITSISRTDSPGSSDSACPTDSVQVTMAADPASPATTPTCCHRRAKYSR